MAGNDLRGEVEFQALGRTWTLKVGTGAMRAIENATGKPMAVIGKLLGDEETATITMMVQIFHAALQKHHTDVSLEQVDDIIDDIGQERAGLLIGRAFLAAQPKAVKGGGARPRTATAA